MKKLLPKRPSRRTFRPNGVLHWLAARSLRLAGWRVEGALPDLPKFIAIGAYHTSNWDFVAFLAAMFYLRVRTFWIGKESLFRGPLKPLLRWLGGVPIRRDASYNAVHQIVDVINEHERIIVVLAPEGTRKKVDHWKTGFYYMAVGANVPIVPCGIDYSHKRVIIGEPLWPSGDVEADFTQLRTFYHGITPRYPQQASDIRVRQRDIVDQG